MRLPEAFRSTFYSTSDLPVFTQLLLYGAIPNALCDPFLERLAAIFPESLSKKWDKNESHSTYSHSQPPSLEQPPSFLLQPLQPQDPLERIKEDTGFLYAEYVWIPTIETPPGPERNDDVVLRLCAPLTSLNLKDPQTHWTLLQLGRPETAGPMHGGQTLRRLVRHVPLVTDFPCTVRFLHHLGYQPGFQFAKKGYAFQYQQSVMILVYKIYTLPSPETHRVNLIGVPEMKSNQEIWIVEVIGQPSSYFPHIQALEYLESIERDMMSVVEFLKGWVELHKVDALLLREQIPYSVK